MLGPTYIHESYDFVRKGKKKLVLTTYDDFSTIFELVTHTEKIPFTYIPNSLVVRAVAGWDGI